MKTGYFIMMLFLPFALFSQSVIPQHEGGNKFSITCGDLYFQIDSARGARISSFKHGETELLSLQQSTIHMFGSTFWPSPQSVWGWPPSDNLDNKAYRTSIIGSRITFASNLDGKTMLRFYKTMFANLPDTSIVIDYIMKNEKATAQTWAPWEVTRVLANGLTVFAMGDGSITGNMADRTEIVDGYVWYNQDDIGNKPGDKKFFSDGKGWLAHVINGNKLFIKSFEDIPLSGAAPGEAEIEIYTGTGNTYTELENQGAYASIAPKDSVLWRVKWFARHLPEDVIVEVGSESLVRFIENVLSRSVDPVSSNEIEVASFVKVFPNPATNYINVEIGNGETEKLLFSIYDLHGRNLLSREMIGKREVVSVEKLPKGTYFYKFTSGETTKGKGKFSIIR
jgi:hypothetical protein